MADNLQLKTEGCSRSTQNPGSGAGHSGQRKLFIFCWVFLACLKMLFNSQDTFLLIGHCPPRMPCCTNRSVNPQRRRQFDPRRWIQVWTGFLFVTPEVMIYPFLILFWSHVCHLCAALPRNLPHISREYGWWTLCPHTQSAFPSVLLTQKNLPNSPCRKGLWNSKRIEGRNVNSFSLPLFPLPSLSLFFTSSALPSSSLSLCPLWL